jgi:hypothetical protein
MNKAHIRIILFISEPYLWDVTECGLTLAAAWWAGVQTRQIQNAILRHGQ